jgi:hypothetical protein
MYRRANLGVLNALRYVSDRVNIPPNDPITLPLNMEKEGWEYA